MQMTILKVTGRICPAKTARGEYDGIINSSRAATTKEKGAAIGDPNQISCAVCNQRFPSCWALLRYLADFYNMKLFRLDDTAVKKMEQLKNRPTQEMPQMKVQPMQMGLSQLNMQQEMFMQTLAQKMLQFNPSFYPIQQQSGTPSMNMAMNNSSGFNAPSTSQNYVACPPGSAAVSECSTLDLEIDRSVNCEDFLWLNSFN
ncbi:hypothetical protein WR25_02049 isoform B [Diploscapter pachys]|nr:hypothetical protein WR25_02049 isoform B [Diploscapter pachys]